MRMPVIEHPLRRTVGRSTARHSTLSDKVGLFDMMEGAMGEGCSI